MDKIVVHKADRSTGDRTQEVEIYLKFIGKFDVPVPEPTPEELAAEEKARRKRARSREAARRYREKKRKALQAAKAAMNENEQAQNVQT